MLAKDASLIFGFPIPRRRSSAMAFQDRLDFVRSQEKNVNIGIDQNRRPNYFDPARALYVDGVCIFRLILVYIVHGYPHAAHQGAHRQSSVASRAKRTLAPKVRVWRNARSAQGMPGLRPLQWPRCN